MCHTTTQVTAIQVGILGATGVVGQRFTQLLDDHPTFKLATLTASEESAGKRYGGATKRRVDTPIPDNTTAMEIGSTDPATVPDNIDLLFSSLPSSVTTEVKPAFLETGYVVSSSSSNDRMAPDVPLTIPKMNPEHLDLIEAQCDEHNWDDALVKNPNYSTITMVSVLATFDQPGLERVDVTTLQAVSGTGHDGITSMEIIDNTIPRVGGEDEKMGTESCKLLGSFDGTKVTLHGAEVDTSCNRIPALDGHLESVFADLTDDASPEDVATAVREYPGVGFPSTPKQFIHVFGNEFRPQPHLDRNRGDGMQISADGIQSTDHDVKYDYLAHNTTRGAADVSVPNGELFAQGGWI